METKKILKEAIEERPFPASVAQVFDNGYKIVINRGSEHGIKKSQRFQIYVLSEEEIIDPVSREPLGHLEIVKGIGKVVNIQPKMATLESIEQRVTTERKIVKKLNPIYSIIGGEEETIIPKKRLLPFDEPEIGDKVRPI